MSTEPENPNPNPEIPTSEVLLGRRSSFRFASHNQFPEKKFMERDRRTCVPGLALAAFFLSSALAQEAKTAATLAELRQRLAEHVSQPKFAAATWGVKVISLDTGKTLFEHNAQKLFSPASNSKLFTVALALERLGPDYRVKTSLYAPSKPDPSGTLASDLIIFGRGDPCITARLYG